MRVLVAFGSKRGGTEGVARVIGQALSSAGLDARVVRARSARDVALFDAIIVAGAVYANRWHRDARAFTKRNLLTLRSRPVWMVSSGPLNGSAAKADLAPVPQVARLMKSVGARGHATFGGPRHVRRTARAGADGPGGQGHGGKTRRALAKPTGGARMGFGRRHNSSHRKREQVGPLSQWSSRCGEVADDYYGA